MNDSATHCKVVWEKTPMLADETYYIYRLNYLSVYELLDSVQAPDSSYYIDYSSSPAASSYRYKISRKDSCGNITALSQMHQSIHLQASTGTGQVNLSWSEYLGISIPTYYISRGTDPWNMSVLDSISAVFVSYSDLNPNPSEPYYQIRMVNPNPCNITRSQLPYVVSNVSGSVLPSGIPSANGVKLRVYPNPAREIIHFVMEKFTHQKLLISVTDILGNDLLEVPLKEGRATVNLSNFSKGMYFYAIHDKGIPITTGKFAVE